MSISVSLTLHTERVKGLVRERCERVVGRTTTELEAATKVRIAAVGAVDTGNMLGTVNSESLGLEGTVHVPAPYSLFVHEGYHLVAWGHETHRYIPGRPFLRQAADIVRPGFMAGLDAAVN